MKLIADAGATKISWAIIHKEEVIKFKTSGYNPNISDSNYLRQLLISGFPADFDSNGIMEILYCGAGCGSVFGKDRVQKALKYFFQKVSDINVLTDLEGAAKGMLGQKSGVIGILGTGANAGLYDGNSIIKSPPSVGFMLGDEGSGAYLGKELTKKILRNELSEIIVDKFYEYFSLDSSELIKKIYSSTKPNQYFGSFVPFLTDNIKEPQIEELINLAFEQFYEKYLEPILPEQTEKKIYIVGGVASAFKNQLKKVLFEKKFELEIIASPLDAIISKHIF